MIPEDKLPASLLKNTVWGQSPNPIWIASTLQLKRNLARYKFPHKLSPKEALTVRSLLSELVHKEAGLSVPVSFPLESCDAWDKEFFFEHFLCLENFPTTASAAECILDTTGKILCTLNFQNHLHLHALDTSCTLEESWIRLSKIEGLLSSKIDFAFSQKFGYLASKPAESGTALFACCHLHLPALIHSQKLPELLLKQKEEEISIRGLEGVIDDPVGDILLLKNRYTLGLSEETLIQTLLTVVMRLMGEEKNLRAQLKEKDPLEFKDKISRAYGLLIHSQQLQTKEALNALSLLNLGVDLNWVSGITSSQLHTLSFQTRRGHLIRLIQEKTPEIQELAPKRATFLHEALKNVVVL